jgi:HlyD family secretion protein
MRAHPQPSPRRHRWRSRWQGLSDHDQVGVCLAGMGALVALWALVWPVPTEVVGHGVLIYPDTAGVLNARSGGQVRTLSVRVGDPVRRGQVLMRLYLPVLERQLAQQRGNLAQLERHDRELSARDQRRLQSEQVSLETALAKLVEDSPAASGRSRPSTPASCAISTGWPAGRWWPRSRPAWWGCSRTSPTPA